MICQSFSFKTERLRQNQARIRRNPPRTELDLRQIMFNLEQIRRNPPQVVSHLEQISAISQSSCGNIRPGQGLVCFRQGLICGRPCSIWSRSDAIRLGSSQHLPQIKFCPQQLIACPPQIRPCPRRIFFRKSCTQLDFPQMRRSD